MGAARRFGVTLCGILIGGALTACASSQQSASVPPIAVNQHGLSERLAATAPREESTVQDSTPSESPQTRERIDSAPVASSDDKPRPSHPIEADSARAASSDDNSHPSRPSEVESALRVSFRQAPVESATPAFGPRAPSDELTPERDGRRQTFAEREALRAGGR